MNSELRFDLGTIETVAVPISIGITAFMDVGKVWVKGESSDKWHRGYGGSLYLSPLNENYNFTISIATSEEENALFEFGVGFKL